MQPGQFDAWTRRRVGWSLGGLAAALMSLKTGSESEAHKKRCPKFGCPQRVCCACDPTDAFPAPYCQVIDGSTEPTDCFHVCSGGGHFVRPVEGYATLCDIDDQCAQIGCAQFF
jgi:hypothetical protein